MNKNSLILFAFAVALLVPLKGTAVSQSLIVKHFGVPDSLKKYSSNTAVLEVIKGNKPISSTSVRQDDKINIIVELSSPPKKSTLAISSAKNTISAEQSSFINGVTSVQFSNYLAPFFRDPLNAVSITATRKSVGAIARLPGVKNITRTRK